MKNLIIIFTILLLASCSKKERTINITGKVYDPALQKAVAGATVVLKAAKVESGVYNPSYVEIASAATGNSGEYSFEVNVEKVSGYRFVVSKDNYFGEEVDVTTDDMEKNDSYSADFEIYPKAKIHLTVKNTQPQGMDDEIKYRYKNIESKCKTCCNNTTVTGTGPTYSSDTECDVRGEKWIYISWVVTKKGNQHIYEDSIRTEAFKTSNYNISY
jgi:hypothetical protein